jgi:chaperonin GroES
MLYPEGNKVLVKPDTAEEVSKGGIIIPDSVQDSHQTAITRGVIVAVGPHAETCFCEKGDFSGVTKRAPKVGDRVIFAKFSGSSIKYGPKREEFRFILDENVVCFIDDDEKEEPVARKSMVK